jgi:hypothetical protein
MERTLNGENFGCLLILCFFATSPSHPYSFIPLGICALAYLISSFREKITIKSPVTITTEDPDAT